MVLSDQKSIGEKDEQGDHQALRGAVQFEIGRGDEQAGDDPERKSGEVRGQGKLHRQHRQDVDQAGRRPEQ